MLKINVAIDLKSLQKELSTAHQKVAEQEVNKLVAELKDATPVDTGAARDAWKVDKLNGKFTIVNDQPYVSDLNEGHSQQAPAHFIEQTVLNHPNVIVRGQIVSYD